MIKRRTLIVVIVLIWIAMFFSYVNYSESINKSLAVGVMICSLIWVYKCWNNIYLLILSLFITYSNYSVVVGIYLDPQLRPQYLYPQINDIQVYGTGIAVVFIFMLSLSLLMTKVKKDSLDIRNNFVRDNNYNSVLFFLIWIVFNLIVVFGYSRNAGMRAESSPIYEYNVILLLLLFFYSGDKKIPRFFCIESMVIYTLSSVIGGNRVEALICLIVFVLCYFKKPLKQVMVLFGMVGGLMFFSIIGTIRGNWLLLSQNFWDIFKIIFRDKFVFDTCTYAYFPMLCMVEMFIDFSVTDAFHYLVRFLLTILMGQNRVEDGDLIYVTSKKYFHNFGGFTLGFFYVWFAYFGSIIMSIVVYYYENLIIKNSKNISDYKKIALLYAVATVPRWYLYGPWALTRGIAVCEIIFFMSRCANNVIKK